MQLADFIALIGYFILIAGIGVWTAKKVTDMTDFVMPRKFGKTMMLFFGFGSGTHSDQAVSVAAKSYTNGVSGIWYQWLWLFCTPFYWLIAPMMRRFRALTTADVFELRFGRSVAILFAVVGLAQYTVNIGVMLKGASAVIESSTGGLVDANWAIIVMTILFVAYGMAGGLHAAILTDFIQGILTVVFSFLLLPFVLNAIGGLEGLRASIPAEKLSLVAPADIGLFYVVIIAFNALIGVVAQPHTMANCAAGRTELDGQVGFMGGSYLKRICTVAWALTGVAAIAYFAQEKVVDIPPDHVFGEIAHRFLPDIMPGLLGLFIAGLLASVMSSCDAFMVSTAGLFTENLYKKVRPSESGKHYLLIARLASLGIVVSGVVFAFALENVIQGLEIFWKIAPMLGIAFWMGLFWRRMNVAGAWSSTLCAFGMWWLTTLPLFIKGVAALPMAESWNLIVLKGDVQAIALPWQMIFYLSVGTIAGVVASLATRRPDEGTLERYYSLLRAPVKEDEVLTEPCVVPEGTPILPARKLIPSKSFEIYVPSRQLVIGFAVGWVGVGLLIAVMYALVY